MRRNNAWTSGRWRWLGCALWATLGACDDGAGGADRGAVDARPAADLAVDATADAARDAAMDGDGGPRDAHVSDRGVDGGPDRGPDGATLDGGAGDGGPRDAGEPDGQPPDCDPACADDDNPCTRAVCVDGQCQAEPAAGPCDDGDACTLDDACVAGACVGGEARACPDAPCMVAACEPATGCSLVPLDCGDGDLCTTDLCDGVAGCVNPAWGGCPLPMGFDVLDFDDPQALGLFPVGAAAIAGGALDLTGPPAAAGAAWWRQPLAAASGFEVSFTFRAVAVAGAPGGGLAFVLQTEGPLALGEGPLGLADGGLAVAVDATAGELVLRYGAARVASAAIAPPADGDAHQVTVTYTPGVLAVIYDGEPRLEAPVVLQAAQAVDAGGQAWMGFTGRAPDAGGVTFRITRWAYGSRCGTGPCDDADPCTVDVCQDGACQAIQDPCDDANPCTVDVCDAAEGGCVHAPVICDDGNACTVDRCDPGLGCTAEPEACDPDLWWPEIAPQAGMIATGDAAPEPGVVRLTAARTGQRGAAWLPLARALAHPLRVTAQIHLTGGDGGGGDRFALALQDESPLFDWGPQGLAPLGLAVEVAHGGRAGPTLQVWQRGERRVAAPLPDAAAAEGTHTLGLTLGAEGLSVDLDGLPVVARLPLALDAVAPGGRAWLGVMAAAGVGHTAHALAGLTVTSDCAPTCSGACDMPHAGPGCGDAAIAACVCAQDPTCCADGWGEGCAALASGVCAICPGCGDGRCDGALGEDPTRCPADCGDPALCEGDGCDPDAERCGAGCVDDGCATVGCDAALGCVVQAVAPACDGAAVRSAAPVAAPLLPGLDAGVAGYVQMDFDLAFTHIEGLALLVRAMGGARQSFFEADPAAHSFSTRWRLRSLATLDGAPYLLQAQVAVSFLVGYQDADAARVAYERARTRALEQTDLRNLVLTPADFLNALFQVQRRGVTVAAAIHQPGAQRWSLFTGDSMAQGPAHVGCAPPLSHGALGALGPAPAGWFDHQAVARNDFGDAGFADRVLLDASQTFLAVPGQVLPAAVDQHVAVLRLAEGQTDVAFSGRLGARDEAHLRAVLDTLNSPAFVPNHLGLLLLDLPAGLGFDTQWVGARAGARTAGGGWLWRPPAEVTLHGASVAEAAVRVCTADAQVGAPTADAHGRWDQPVAPAPAGEAVTFGAAAGAACDPDGPGGWVLETLPACAWPFAQLGARAAGAVGCGEACAQDADCDDANACTTDRCTEGACVRALVVCDDGDACTTDTCDPARGCEAAPSVACDDGNPCTDDACDPLRGCGFTPNAAACDDGNACTVDDRCVAGACGGTPAACDDGDPCTGGDACLPGGCAGTPLICDDGDACTADVCVDGACQAPPACDDGLPCTDDACALTCPMGERVGGRCFLGLHPPQALDAAAAGAACAAEGGHLATLSDAAEVAAARGVLPEACAGAAAWVGLDHRGWVTGEPVTYLGGLAALPGRGEAVSVGANGTFLAVPAGAALGCAICEARPEAPTCGHANQCADGSLCTADLCTEAGCDFAPVDCDDGNACTADLCDPETGCRHAGGDCDDGDPCTTDACDPELGCSHAFCDDGDPCTANVCDPVEGCTFTGGDCDDGDACTVDRCDPDEGCAHTPLDCDDGNPCTADRCDPVAGCAHEVLPDDTACDVSDCAQEHCQAGECVPFANEWPSTACPPVVCGYSAGDWITRGDAEFVADGVVLNENNLFVTRGTVWLRTPIYMADGISVFFRLVTDHGNLAQGNGVSVNFQGEGNDLNPGSFGVRNGLAVWLVASYGTPRVVVRVNGVDVAVRGLPVDPGADSLRGMSIPWS
ncbi:MAG: hypothetical protein H6702_13875, partial [Myxococcales bacterium]|nr:hypothetical protein [Myxococcales bacterium]